MPCGGRHRRVEVQGVASANLIEVQAAPPPGAPATNGEAAPHDQLATNAKVDDCHVAAAKSRGRCFRCGCGGAAAHRVEAQMEVLMWSARPLTQDAPLAGRGGREAQANERRTLPPPPPTPRACP